MDTVRLHHHTHQDNLDELKFALLYFDKIEIPIFHKPYIQQMHKDSKKYMVKVEDMSITNEYLTHIKSLEDSGIVKIEKVEYDLSMFESSETLNVGEIPDKLGAIVLDDFGKFF